MTKNEDDLSAVDALLANARCRLRSLNVPEIVSRSELVEVLLPATRSRIVQQNEHRVFASFIPGSAGLLLKSDPDSRRIGEFLCEVCKRRFASAGFISSDELPAYGISRGELRKIIGSLGASRADLILIYAYDRTKSERMDGFLRSSLTRIIQEARRDAL